MKGLIPVVRLQSHIVNKNMCVYYFGKITKSENASALDSTGPIRRPGLEVGGGVNPSLRTYIPLNHWSHHGPIGF